jgi:NitT/TauT family transport system substrate-binding protein
MQSSAIPRIGRGGEAMIPRVLRMRRARLPALLFAAWAAVFATSIAAQTPLTSVSLRLDFLPAGYHAPLFLAVQRGYYREHGIDLQIGDGRGSNPSLQSVAAGNDMIVLANYGTMTEGITKGMPVIGVGGLIQRLPDGVIWLRGSGIKAPKDLEGRTMSIPPASAVFKLFAAFVAATGIDMNKIKQVQTDSNAALIGLINGQVDFTTGWVFTDALKVESQKPIDPPMLFADYGVNVLAAGFVVQKATAATKGDTIRRFLAATAKGYQEGLKEPEAAVAAMIQSRPGGSSELWLKQLKLVEPFLQTERSKAHGFGWTAREDWEQTIVILKKYFGMTASVDAASLYTNDLLPSQ